MKLIERKIIGLELVREIEEKVNIIRNHLKAAED